MKTQLDPPDHQHDCNCAWCIVKRLDAIEEHKSDWSPPSDTASRSSSATPRSGATTGLSRAKAENIVNANFHRKQAQDLNATFSIDEIANYIAGWKTGRYGEVEHNIEVALQSALSHLSDVQDGIEAVRQRRLSPVKEEEITKAEWSPFFLMDTPPSIPAPPSAGSSKPIVSIDEGTRRTAKKTALGYFRAINSAQPRKRRSQPKIRKGSKPVEWSNAPKQMTLAGISLLLLVIIWVSLYKSMNADRGDAVSSEKAIVPVLNENLANFNDGKTELYSNDPEQIASAFAFAKSVEERSKYVLDASKVDGFSEQARSAIPIKITKIASGSDGKNQYATFEAIFSDGSMRLIAVVPTKNGPKVDWDSYARIGTAEGGVKP